VSYLLLLIPLLAQILTPASHFSAAHGVLFRREMFLLLRLVRQGHEAGVGFFVEAALAAGEFAEVGRCASGTFVVVG
jgi:hypothetical protein